MYILNDSNPAMTKRFKHSGAMGDLIYALSVMHAQGGGEFYLHLNQLDWIGQHYYGSPPSAFHQGRMTESDLAWMQSFLAQQDYITRVGALEPSTEISVNLDRFRPVFVGHPTNYLAIYAGVHGLDPETLGQQPWLQAEPCPVPGRTIAINRTARWRPDSTEHWQELTDQDIESQAYFLGLESEYLDFVAQTGWRTIPYVPTQTLADLAQRIAGAEVFIGNQSQCYALAVALGVPEIHLETRRDLPLDRNECYFPHIDRVVSYF